MEVGNIIQKLICLLCVVHATTVMLQPVAYDEVVDMHHQIVSTDLTEYTFRNLYIGTFVFDDDPRCQVALIDHRVTTTVHPIQRDAHFVGHEGRAVTFLTNQIRCEMLAHPLLRSQCHKSTTQAVPNLGPSVLCLDLRLDWR